MLCGYGWYFRVEAPVHVDALAGRGDVHKERRDRQLTREKRAILGRQRIGFSVGEDDEDRVLDPNREQVVRREREERAPQRGRPAREGPARRWLVDPDRLRDRPPDESVVRRRHEVRQHAVGHRREPDGNVAELREQFLDVLLGSIESRRRVRPGLRAHRQRRVEDEEGLRVGTLADRFATHDDGLGGCDRDEDGDDGESDCDGDEAPAPRRGEGEVPAQRAGTPLHEDERSERDDGRKREEGRRRSEERDARQKPPPTGAAPSAPPNPNPPRASEPKWDLPGRFSLSTSSRLTLAVQLAGFSAIARWKSAIALLTT